MIRGLILATFISILNFYPTQAKEVNMDLVQTEEVAIAIAVAVWTPRYGKEKVDRYRPYHAKLDKGFWHITGTPPDKMAKGGGSPEAVISKRDGQITRVSLAR